MIVLPDTAKAALDGINRDLAANLPYISYLNPSADSTPIWVVPVATGGSRLHETPPK